MLLGWNVVCPDVAGSASESDVELPLGERGAAAAHTPKSSSCGLISGTVQHIAFRQ